MFRTPFALSSSAAVEMAARKAPYYDNQRVRARKYKSLAKLNRKMKKASAMSGSRNPRDFGEEMPPFFLAPRYKLLYKVLQDQKNAQRVQRKPMPEALRKDFAEQSKAYHQYKLIERAHIEREENEQLQVQIKALDAIVWLPDYLMEECLSEKGEIQSQDMQEFRPAVLYMEQMMHLYPRELTCRWKLFPAFEESLMRIEEARSLEDSKQ